MPENGFLDRLVDATTACLTWARLVEMMAGGYTPTVYPTTRRKRLLIRCIQAAGYRTWPDARTGGDLMTPEETKPKLTPEERQRLMDERDAAMAGEDVPPPSPKAVPYDDLMDAFKIVE